MDPFNPPYTTNQLLVLGTNGSTTVEFVAPLTDDPQHLFGLDFILYAGAGFMITNGDYSGGGLTDGSVFGANSATPQFSISADGVQYFKLDPALVKAVIAPWPIDGEGSFTQPIDPALAGEAFAGKNLAGIRRRYNGSAGGAGFDLAWARDGQGNPAGLRSARFLRIDSPEGTLKIDGLAAVETPVNIAETFNQDPATTGWLSTGDTNLFQWDAARLALQATWDSAQPNSFFYRPLGITLNKQDDFSLAFDLTLDSIVAGQTPDKTFTFELAIGFINRASAFATNFIRGTGNPSDAPNLVEFDYFPDTGLGATVSTAITCDSLFLTANSYPLELTAGSTFHVELNFAADGQTLSAAMTKDGQAFGPINSLPVKSNFANFAVDAVAISSYSDQGAGGSLLATGRVDNLQVTLPKLVSPHITGRITAAGYEASFQAQANVFYALERSTNLVAWSEAASATATQTGPLTLTDTQKPGVPAWYRLRALRQ